MTCSFLFLTGKMSISSVFVTMLAFNLAVFPCPLFHKLKAQGAEKTADFLQFGHEALSSVACPIPLSLIHGYYLNMEKLEEVREGGGGADIMPYWFCMTADGRY